PPLTACAGPTNGSLATPSALVWPGRRASTVPRPWVLGTTARPPSSSLDDGPKRPGISSAPPQPSPSFARRWTSRVRASSWRPSDSARRTVREDDASVIPLRRALTLAVREHLDAEEALVFRLPT